MLPVYPVTATMRALYIPFRNTQDFAPLVTPTTLSQEAITTEAVPARLTKIKTAALQAVTVSAVWIGDVAKIRAEQKVHLQFIDCCGWAHKLIKINSLSTDFFREILV